MDKKFSSKYQEVEKIGEGAYGAAFLVV
jgi:NIMA (never in mitosis gene a)-related kinase